MTNLNQSDLNRPAVAASTSGLRIPAFAWLLTACIGVIGSNSLALGPIAPEVARSFGTGAASVMTASAAFGLGTAASAILLARLIDRHGGRRMLAVALVMLVAGLGGSAAAPALPLLVAAQFLAGLAAGIALPAIYSLAVAVSPPGRESETVGVVLTGWTLSMVAGVSLSAVVADLAGWRTVYAAVAAATLAACAGVHFARLRETPPAGAVRSPLEALRVPGVAALLCACAAFMASFYGVYAYLGDHLHAGLGLPVSANGLFAFSYGLGFGSAVFLDRFIDRSDAGRLLPAIFVAVAAVYAVMAAAAGSYMLMLAAVFVWGLVNHFGLNVLIVRMTALAPEKRGLVMGLNSGVTYLALFAGTLGFGMAYDRAGFAVLLPAAAALALVAALFAAAARRSSASY